jgi:hypothetical protein
MAHNHEIPHSWDVLIDGASRRFVARVPSQLLP